MMMMLIIVNVDGQVMHPMTRSLDPKKEGENKATENVHIAKKKPDAKMLTRIEQKTSICCPTVQMLTMWDKPIPNQENCLWLSIEKKTIITL